MAIHSVPENGWSDPIVTTRATIFQVREGIVFITTEDAPAWSDGVRLTEDTAVLVSASLPVRFRTGDGREFNKVVSTPV